MESITLFENIFNETFKDSKYVVNILNEAFLQGMITEKILNDSIMNILNITKQYVYAYIDEEELLISESTEEILIFNTLYEYGFYVFSNFSKNVLDKLLNVSLDDLFEAQKFMEKTLINANNSILEILKIAKKIDVLDFMYLVKKIEEVSKYFYKVNQRIVFESYEEYIEPIKETNLPERTLLQSTMNLNSFPNDFLSFLISIQDLKAESEFLSLFNSCDILNVYSNFVIEIKLDGKITTTYYHNVAEAIFVQFLFCNYYYTKEPLSLQFTNKQVKSYIYDIVFCKLTATDLINELELSPDFIKLSNTTQEYFKCYLEKLQLHIETLRNSFKCDNVENWLAHVYEKNI